MFTYRGKTALVTGASSGIGATFAHMLAQRGMHLITADASTLHTDGQVNRWQSISGPQGKGASA